MHEKIRSLPLEQKIGQLFFIGLPGTELDNETKSLLSEVSAGGVCLFTRNIKESVKTRNLLDGLREILPVEPILSLDQEGGLVDRLRRILSPMPSASALKTNQNVEKLAQITAEIISILGFNTNFAPVVDIPTERSLVTQNGLQSRFLGENVKDVIKLSQTYLKTLQDNRILGCPKHFPGIGASIVDSHEELPQVTSDYKSLSEIDLLPYLELLPEMHCVMIAHAAFPNLDLQEQDQNGKLLPSSLSFNIITKLLRQKIGFNGLVVTDDLEMGAILKNYPIGEACRMAFHAGVDMFLICNSIEAVRNSYKTILEAVKSGDISETRLNESLERIADFKKLMHSPLPFDQNRLAELSVEVEQLNSKLK